MPRIRKELVRGSVILCVFLAVIITTDLFFYQPFEQAGYTVVTIRRLNEYPLDFEGLAISSRATIVSINESGSNYIADVSEGATLIFPSAIGHPNISQRILFRGTSLLVSNRSILVTEFYSLDYSSSIIRSIPGILLFAILFFSTFKFDLKRVVFVLRKEENESA